jgi:serine protease Do
MNQTTTSVLPRLPALLLHSIMPLFVGMALAAVQGAQPEFQLQEHAKLQGYQKVYLAPIKKDVGKVYPGLLARLQKCGFEVVELKLEKLPFASQGSGFVLSPEGDVLTCAHVVGEEPKATLWIGGTRYLARILAVDTNLDAEVMRVEGEHPPFRPLRFAPEPACRLGQEAYDMGFPLADLLGTSARINKGLISATVGLHGDTNHVQISAEVQPGNSGGPVLNPQAEVVGMVAATINPLRVLAQTGGDLPQNINFAIKTGPLLQFLTKAGVTLTESNSAPAGNFEEAGKSLALIRGGIVDEARLREKPLVCTCGYVESRGEFLALRLVFLTSKTLTWPCAQIRQSSRDVLWIPIWIGCSRKFVRYLCPTSPILSIRKSTNKCSGGAESWQGGGFRTSDFGGP